MIGDTAEPRPLTKAELELYRAKAGSCTTECGVSFGASVMGAGMGVGPAPSDKVSRAAEINAADKRAYDFARRNLP